MSRFPALLLLAALSACSRPDLQVYAVAKESPRDTAKALPEGHPPIGETAMGGEEGSPFMGGVPAEEALAVSWTAPKDWKERPGSGMRVATFLVPSRGGKTAEVSVISLPGDAGGDLANINRWRGQLGLGALSEGELSRQSRSLRSPAGELLVVDFSGAAEKGRMVGARLLAGGQSWFFKMTGPEAVVAAAKPSFEGFLRSLKHGE